MGKHKKNKRDICNVPDQEGAAESVLENDAKKKKKNSKRKISEVEEETIDIPITATDCLNGEHVKKKKKKKCKNKEKIEDDDTDDHQKEKMCKLDNNPEEVTDHKTSPKKKKKRKKHMDTPDELAAETVPVEEAGSNCKKRKKRKHEPSDSAEEAVEDKTAAKTSDESALHKLKKKKKKKHRSDDDNEVAQNSESVAEKDKICKLRNKNEMESEKGNVLKSAHEKQPLAKYKDKDGGVFDNTSEPLQPVMGQWNTASLGDENRQNKFLRLLGGFKTGGDTSVIKKKFALGGKLGTPNSDSQKTGRVGGNFAMDKEQEETYKKNLEKDYDRAMVSNMNRGIGLGFAKPEPSKKFFIDTNKSKSIKFDD